MIDLSAVRTRMRGVALPASSPFFLTVGDSVSAADAMEHLDANPPAAFVYSAGETASKNILATGGRRQRVSEKIAVLILLGAERADEARADPMEVARGLVTDSMTGWTAPGSLKPFDYAGFRIVALGDGLLWAEVLFDGEWLLSKAT